MKLTSGCLWAALTAQTFSLKLPTSFLEQSATDDTLQVEFSLRTNDTEYEHFSHASFPDYQLRMKSPQLCDPNVKQHSGYLDVSEDKHIFFWFFEARNRPQTAPVVIWLNGGPGCSSAMGLFFALGPCRIEEDGKSTTLNKYSWNTNANMLFIDQPAGVGFSYNNGPTVDDSFIAADDMWAFLQLFYKRFDQYSGELHVSGESYAGTYIPHIASSIYRHNKALENKYIPSQSQHINLTSVLIGNGLTDPYPQFGALYEWLCDGKWKVLDKEGPECAKLKKDVGVCQRLIKACNDDDTDLTCGPASSFCFDNVLDAHQPSGLNPYDARLKCNSTEACYASEGWITTYLNNPLVKKELGVPLDLDFEVCKEEMEERFLKSGDVARSSAVLLPELIEAGLRVLIYVGEADLLNPGIGQIPWLENLKTTYQQSFVDSPRLDFRIHNRTAGFVKSSGKKRESGVITYVEIFEAGHMVPHDQPDAALDMFTRWLEERPMADVK
ncbi:serine carboxypeptidase [Ceratobasidium sp. AG-I]|nr:serine carboxypeptidase [Ceratobasidium sp. AG-I]